MGFQIPGCIVQHYIISYLPILNHFQHSNVLLFLVTDNPLNGNGIVVAPRPDRIKPALDFPQLLNTRLIAVICNPVQLHLHPDLKISGRGIIFYSFQRIVNTAKLILRTILPVSLHISFQDRLRRYSISPYFLGIRFQKLCIRYPILQPYLRPLCRGDSLHSPHRRYPVIIKFLDNRTRNLHMIKDVCNIIA